jgi:hypothetical protein
MWHESCGVRIQRLLIDLDIDSIIIHDPISSFSAPKNSFPPQAFHTNLRLFLHCLDAMP